MEGTAIRNNNDNLFINEQIRDREVRVIGADGEMLGIMSANEARKLAEEADLDLVKISPGAKPPVCKIIDYGKYKYEKTRKEKDAKKKQHTVEISLFSKLSCFDRGHDAEHLAVGADHSNFSVANLFINE